MIKIFGIVFIAAAIAFGSPSIGVPTEKASVTKKAPKKKGLRNMLRSSVVFVADSAVFGTSQVR